MKYPSLSELGMVDKRRKIDDSVKQAIKQDLDNGERNITGLARKYGVSVGTVRMIRNPEHEKGLIKKSRQHKNYYNREKQRAWFNDLNERKLKRIKELMTLPKKGG